MDKRRYVQRARAASAEATRKRVLEAARRSLGLYKRGVRDVARRNLDVVRQSYGLGRGALLDVIAEQRRYIEIENGYTEVLKHVYDAAVEIERAAAATSQ